MSGKFDDMAAKIGMTREEFFKALNIRQQERALIGRITSDRPRITPQEFYCQPIRVDLQRNK